MIKKKDISISNLLLDDENPRLFSGGGTQPEIICELALQQGQKLTNLAEDILDQNGTDPGDLPIVVPPSARESPSDSVSSLISEDSDDPHFIVLDGNRRVAALKLMETPNLISGNPELSSLHSKFNSLNDRHLQNPVEKLSCVVFGDEEEAKEWVIRRHTGEGEGTGRVSWDATQKDRFEKRRGEDTKPRLQALEFVREVGGLEADRNEYEDLSISNLERLVNDPDVRERLGFEKENRVLKSVYPPEEVVKGLQKIVDDLIHERMYVDDIRKKDGRRNYLDSFDDENIPDLNSTVDEKYRLDEAADLFDVSHETDGQEEEPESNGGSSDDEQPNDDSSSTSDEGDTDSDDGDDPPRRSRPRSTSRSTVIPRSFVLHIEQDRVNDIYHELKNLSPSDFPNASGVLMRVFLELSLDHFSEQEGPDHWNENSNLGTKLRGVASHLEDNGEITQQQATAFHRYADGGSFLTPSINTMHQYVHNQHLNPSGDAVKTAWNNLQPLFERIWS
ncbi:hypothetical protein [Salinibacter ruber]|uniref:hypothetical protein n=1 Tax=Salinibacter ruber TaxID=146919 RepID=UPI00216786AB|nr:hypothetical protein [Salinibacter ruber]